MEVLMEEMQAMADKKVKKINLKIYLPLEKSKILKDKLLLKNKFQNLRGKIICKGNPHSTEETLLQA